jgi:hypothetical protein
VNVLFAVWRLAVRVVGYQEGTMRSASRSRPKIARRGEAEAALAMMAMVVERCNNAMQCNAGGLGTSIGGGVRACVRAGVWASLIGSATGGQAA